MHKVVCLVGVWVVSVVAAGTAHGQVSPLGPKVANYVTATMEGAYAWFEQGFNPGLPLYGLPPAGYTLADSSSGGTRGPLGTFLMQSYTGNNALLLNSGHTS